MAGLEQHRPEDVPGIDAVSVFAERGACRDDGVVQLPLLAQLERRLVPFVARFRHPETIPAGRSFPSPPSDGSMHAALPPELVRPAIDAGWAELHPLAARVHDAIDDFASARCPRVLSIVGSRLDRLTASSSGAAPGRGNAPRRAA